MEKNKDDLRRKLAAKVGTIALSASVALGGTTGCNKNETYVPYIPLEGLEQTDWMSLGFYSEEEAEEYIDIQNELQNTNLSKEELHSLEDRLFVLMKKVFGEKLAEAEYEYNKEITKLGSDSIKKRSPNEIDFITTVDGEHFEIYLGQKKYYTSEPVSLAPKMDDRTANAVRVLQNFRDNPERDEKDLQNAMQELSTYLTCKIVITDKGIKAKENNDLLKRIDELIKQGSGIEQDTGRY